MHSLTTNLEQFKNLSEDSLNFIIKDASEARECARELGNAEAEGKYQDQISDACTVLYRRKNAATKAKRVKA